MRNMWLGLLLLFPVQVTQAATLALPQAGEWASRGAYLWPGPTAIADSPEGGRLIQVMSPDSSMVLIVSEYEMLLKRSQAESKVIGDTIPVGSLAEVLWAPDSRAFAVTQSDGGSVGSWSVKVYHVTDAGLRSVKVAEAALVDFNRRKVSQRAPGCEVEGGNVGAVAWRDGSKSLMILAEAPNHSSCCDMGRIQGYLVEAQSGVIRARYSRADVQKLFQGDLGARFR
jgi:hypothetical protein